MSAARASTQTQTSQPPAPGGAPWLLALKADADRLIKAATAGDFAWQRLAELTDAHGARFSGSENLQRAIAWATAAMKADGLENVRAERVMVQRWVRAEERFMHNSGSEALSRFVAERHSTRGQRAK